MTRVQNNENDQVSHIKKTPIKQRKNSVVFIQPFDEFNK